MIDILKEPYLHELFWILLYCRLSHSSSLIYLFIYTNHLLILVWNHGYSLYTFRLKTYILQCLEVLKAISLILSPQFNFSSFSGTSFKWWKDSLIVFFSPTLMVYMLHIFSNSLCLVLSFPDKYFSLSSF